MSRLRLPYVLYVLSVFVSLVSLVAACGGGNDSPDADTSSLVVLTAWNETGPQVFMQETLDTSCLNTPSADLPATGTITLNTKVTDFQTDADIPGATVTVFSGVDQTASLGTAVSAANGDLAIDVMQGMPPHKRIGFKITTEIDPGTMETTHFDTFLLQQYLPPGVTPATSPSTISAVSRGTGAALPALVGITRTTGTGVLAGALRDCMGHEIAGFTATVSSTAGAKTPLPNARTFYFGENGLPARNTVVRVGNKNGLFTVLELPVQATAYVQMWGYLNQVDLDARTETLLSELAVPVIADNIITGSYELARTGN